MPATIEKRIVGSWMNAFEEDTPGETVFRPADYEFPPARRERVGYNFRADHTGDSLGSSPRDGWARSACTWRVRGGGQPEIVLEFPGGGSEVLSVVSVDRERLVVRRA